jgi:hypothetical protein
VEGWQLSGTETFRTGVPFTAGMLGNAGRNIGTSPSYTTLDINVSKDTKITERTFIQFRAELFTILNHTNFNYPTLSAFNGNPNPANGGLPGSPAPTAGLITSIIGTSRQIQFGLKLLF